MSQLKRLINTSDLQFSTLGDLAIIKTGNKPAEILETKTAYEYINAGTSSSGYAETFNCSGDTVTTPSRGQGGIGFVGYQKNPFWLGPLCYRIQSKDTSVVANKYLYYYLTCFNEKILACKKEGGTPAVNASDLLGIDIIVPPIDVQSEIVRILDDFTELTTELITELTTELVARKKQYDYYREHLISEAEGTLGKLIDLLSQPITDGPHTTPKLVSDGIPFVSASAICDGKVHFEKAQGFISKEADAEYARKYKPRRNDVFMVKSGSTTGKVAIVDTDEDFNIWSPLAAMRTENEITARYIYHLLQTTSVQNMVLTRMSHGSQPNLSMRVLEQFDVKIPTLQEQERIVSILDRFDTLCNDIALRLPAEIEARQKQYEYYRDKLLTFEVKQ